MSIDDSEGKLKQRQQTIPQNRIPSGLALFGTNKRQTETPNPKNNATLDRLDLLD